MAIAILLLAISSREHLHLGRLPESPGRTPGGVISVACDQPKLDDRRCNGAPDLMIETVSPSSRRMDYSTKNTLYSEAGVQEYWIADPAKERATVYC